MSFGGEVKGIVALPIVSKAQYFLVPLFYILFGIRLRNTLRWAKEAEEYEVHLKEADEIEKECRRRSAWIER